MKELLEANPRRRQNFTLLLNRDENILLAELSAGLGLSKGAVLRAGLRSLGVSAKGDKRASAPLELDGFWKAFRSKENS